MFKLWSRLIGRTPRHSSTYPFEASIRDPRTGLFTNRHFDERLAAEIELAEVYEEPFTLLAIGVDRIDAFRELHGEPRATQTIALVADALRGHLRLADVPTADGHDFLVLMPETSTDDAALTFRRLQHLVADLGASQPDDCFSQFTISGGVFEYDGSRPPEIVRAAILALAVARSLGGNTFHRSTAERVNWQPVAFPLRIDQPVQLRRA